ncbi:MAG: YihY/virulence factor BrkB family protein, partial [Clostridia bacterium]|nr:YihY/virulence factor BrkB family protein [Clostridia bacterium]
MVPNQESPKKEGLPLFRILQMLREAQVGAFAAQAAFFVILSAIPFLVFLTAVLHYVPWTEGDLAQLLPAALGEEILQILPDASPSVAVLSLSAGTALWSASRGVVALTRGLNRMYGRTETRNYFLLRFFALAETLILEIALICTLGGAVQGEALGDAAGADGTVRAIFRTVGGFLLLTLFFLFLYTVLPDHSTGMRRQLPGAMGAAVGWILFTEGYSVYVEQ